MKFMVVMPFRPEFNRVFEAIHSAVHAAEPPGAEWHCLRVDKDLAAGHITAKIRQHLRSADICIADLTGPTPNVMWEVGFIEALPKPLIALSQDTSTLPFNIKDVAVLEYDPDHLTETLHRPLVGAVEQTLRNLSYSAKRLEVAVAGSHGITHQQASGALDRVATPYLGSGTTWYCGFRDPVELATMKFLLDAQQRVVAVRSSGHSPAPDLAARLERHHARVVDADEEPVGRLPPDFNRKFALFTNRADTILLLWDGKSQKVKEFHDWLSNAGRDHVLARA